MEQEDNNNNIVEMPMRDIEDLYPYARLICAGLERKALEKICTVLSLKVTQPESRAVFYLTSLNPQPGEHKLHTVTLLAAAVLFNQLQPQCRMSLSTQIDFMQDRQPFPFNSRRELKGVAPGVLKASAACQLFLFQAGLGHTPLEEDIYFGAEALQNFRVLLQKQPSLRLAAGA